MLFCFFSKTNLDWDLDRGGDQGGTMGVDKVASYLPLWARLSLELRKGTKLSLRRFCLGLF